MSITEVPSSWWRFVAESIATPVACLTRDGHFVWVNHAYQKLLGWSFIELCGHIPGNGMRWQDVTDMRDIGAETASDESIIDGPTKRYTIRKTHKYKGTGDPVPVVLNVFRHPEFGPFLCFLAEVIPLGASEEEMYAIENRMKAAYEQQDAQIHVLLNRVAALEEKRQAKQAKMKIDQDHDNTKTNTTVNVGNNQTTWIVAIGGLIVFGVLYWLWLEAFPIHKGEAEPPRPPIVQPMD